MRVLHTPRHIRRMLFAFLRGGVLAAALALATAGGAAIAQNEDARLADWVKVETATETRAFKEAMRGGGAFDAAARGYLEQIALPQLALEANRATIAGVRRRMREFLLGDVANEKSMEDANQAVLAFMSALAEKDDAEPVVRVNAMLMIGELQGVDRKPLQSAAAVLARAASNPDLPKAVRIAACIGLNRHAEATRGIVEEQKRMASVAGPAILAMLEASAAPKSAGEGPAVEDDWLASRCLSMLSFLGPGSPETIAAAARILGDGARAIDVRVRAAAALAAAAGPDAKVDPAAIIPVIAALAIESLERDVAAADRLMLERQIGADAGLPSARPPIAGPPGMIGDPATQPAVEQLIPSEVCRRAAWRLGVLADAILAEDSKRGLALLAAESEARTAFLERAQALRRAALDLDATPEEEVLRQALVDLKRPAAGAADANERLEPSGGTQ